MLLSELKDECIQFLAINLYSFKLEDLFFERADDKLLLVAFCLCEGSSSDGCLSVVQVLAIHL